VSTQGRRIGSRGYWYLLPAAVTLGVLIVYPAARALQYSLERWNGVSSATFVGFANYAATIEDPIERAGLVHVAILFVFYALLPSALGLVAAALVARMRVRGLGLVRAIYFLPQVVVTVVVAIVWSWILAPRGGVTLDWWLHLVGLGAPVGVPWLDSFHTALLAIGLVALWLQFGLCFVLLLAGIQRVPPELYEAARLDGAGLVREFVSLTVPLLRRDLGAAVTISTVAALANFTLIYQATLGGPGTSTVVPGLTVYNDGFLYGEVGTASALGVVLAALVFVVTFGIRWYLDRRAVDF
jgi:raffinose/stachyose/melibiose transport system permease protein